MKSGCSKPPRLCVEVIFEAKWREKYVAGDNTVNFAWHLKRTEC